MPAPYAPAFRTQSQNQIAMGNSQANDEVPWSSTLLDTQTEGNIAAQDSLDPVTAQTATTVHVSPSDGDNDSDAAIGIVLKNGRFKCNMAQCADKSHGRTAELRRHYDTTHATKKPEFWCQVLHCDRSAAVGGQPFHRKYRLQDHMRNLHGGRVEMSDDDDNEEEE